MKERIHAQFFKTIKIAVGSAVSIVIANMLSLSFGTSAGIITLLSVQNTKKGTLRVAGRRILAFIIAICLSWSIFTLCGYSTISFGLFLFLFVILCELWNLQEGISLCAVIVTHFLTWEHMYIEDIWNEFLLLIIGIGVGAATNLYIPRNVKEIRRCQAYIEIKMREILNGLSLQLTEPSKRGKIIGIDELHLYIQKAVAMAYENSDNTFLADTQYFIRYMEMRLAQLSVLERVYVLVQKVDDYSLVQTRALADFINHIASSLQETNNGEQLLVEYERLKGFYENNMLPQNRVEFENRAMLYQILCEIQWFIQLKMEFAKNLTSKQIEEFWGKDNV